MSGHHVEPIRLYLTIFFALMGLTALTVFASTVDLGPLNNLVAMAIALSKATLVVLFFMHVRHSNNLTKATVIAGFFWLIILFAFTFADIDTRGMLPFPGK